MIETYIIVNKEGYYIHNAIQKLEKAINELIQEGWIPCGSFNVKRDSSQKHTFVAFQAMIKEKGEAETSPKS